MKTDEQETNYAHLAKHNSTHSIKLGASALELTGELKLEDVTSEDQRNSNNNYENKNSLEEYKIPREKAMRSRMDPEFRHKNSVDGLWNDIPQFNL